MCLLGGGLLRGLLGGAGISMGWVGRGRWEIGGGCCGYEPGRKPGWEPKMPLKVSRMDLLVSTRAGSSGRGMVVGG